MKSAEGSREWWCRSRLGSGVRSPHLRPAVKKNELRHLFRAQRRIFFGLLYPRHGNGIDQDAISGRASPTTESESRGLISIQMPARMRELNGWGAERKDFDPPNSLD